MKLGKDTPLETKCGCYYCLETCDFKDVTCFVDDGNTALCPNCGIDSLVELTDAPHQLTELHELYFGEEDEPTHSEQGRCYQCEKKVVYLFDDGRCGGCTRLTREEIEGSITYD